MGTTSAKVSERFKFLATFPYSNPTKNDIKRLERRVNKALCRIKCMGLPEWVVKGLLKDGFSSSKLIKWGNQIIDSTINSDNMESYVRFVPLLQLVANNIKYLEPLPWGWKKYMDALRTDPSSAIRVIRSITIIFVFFFLHAQTMNQTRLEKSDIEMTEVMLKESSAYIQRFFPYVNEIDASAKYVNIQPDGSSVVSSFGIINAPRANDTHKDITGIGQYQLIGGRKHAYLPVFIAFKNERLECYYNPNTGEIRYVQTPGDNFKPISELITYYRNRGIQPGDQPWVYLPDTYPLARKNRDTLNPPFSYINLNFLGDDALLFMNDANTIHLPRTRRGFRLIYSRFDPDDETTKTLTFYCANIDEKDEKKFLTVVNGKTVPSARIKPADFEVRLQFYTKEDGKFIDGIDNAGESNEDGFYKIRVARGEGRQNDVITIGEYGYLVGEDTKQYREYYNYHKYLTQVYKTLVKYQYEEPPTEY